MNTPSLESLRLKAEKAVKGDWSSTHIFCGEEVLTTGFDGQDYIGTIQDQLTSEFIASANPSVLIPVLDELIEARKVIEFYADILNWYRVPRRNYEGIIVTDLDEFEEEDYFIGGKLARAHQSKYMKEEK